MKSRLIILAIASVGLVFGLFVVSAQQSDEEVRGAFLSTRPKTTNANAPARRRRTPRNTNTSSTTTGNSNNVKNANSNKSIDWSKVKIGDPKVIKHDASQAIGLGYTLFMRDVNGRTARVEPTREFHNGDRVRISMEPNIDGYLYIFDSEDGGPPQMIYPDARLDGGENWI